MEKYRTTRRLIILSLVTSLQERQRHWQFALQFLFAALHGQQPRPLFRAQAPLHGQETSTDPWSYLTRMANLMNGWKRGGSTFSPSSKYSQGFSYSSLRQQPIDKRLLLINGFICFHAGLKHRTVLNRIKLNKLFKFMGENAEDVLRQRDKVKITDQSVVLFKQKRSFKTKTNDRVVSGLEMGL